MNRSAEQIVKKLRVHGVVPTAQRLAVAEVVFNRDVHPSAEDVLERVRDKLPTVSRATVYNTLNLFVAKGLLRAQILHEGHTVFDPNTHEHHHFIDDVSGEIHDIPSDALKVVMNKELEDYEIRDIEIIVRGRRKE